MNTSHNDVQSLGDNYVLSQCDIWEQMWWYQQYQKVFDIGDIIAAKFNSTGVWVK